MHPLQCQIQLENHFPFNSNGCNVKLRATTVQSKQSQLALGISFSISRLDIRMYGGGVNFSWKWKTKKTVLETVDNDQPLGTFRARLSKYKTFIYTLFCITLTVRVKEEQVC